MAQSQNRSLFGASLLHSSHRPSVPQTGPRPPHPFGQATTPTPVDYYNLAGPSKGAIEHGIIEWQGDTAHFCITSAGQPRPTTFTSAKGSGHTLSHWKPSDAKPPKKCVTR